MSRWLGGFYVRMMAVLAIILGLGFILWMWPQHWTEKSEIQIRASEEQVFLYLERMDLWPQWIGWKIQDPSWVHVLGPIQKGQGASLQWNGALTGVGTLTLSRVKTDTLIHAEIHMNQGGKGLQTFEILPDSAGILLKITADFNLGFNPWARYTHRELRSQTHDRLRLEALQLKDLAEKDAQWALAQKAAAADSISQIPMDTISTEIPLAE